MKAVAETEGKKRLYGHCAPPSREAYATHKTEDLATLVSDYVNSDRGKGHLF